MTDLVHIERHEAGGRQNYAGKLGARPLIHPTAEIRDCGFGPWTAVGARTVLIETTLLDYSYVVEDADLAYTRAGKFCSIAAKVRINPGNHPTWRASQHHFVYRAAAYDLGADEADFFAWRRRHEVRLGHDVWIGHGAIVLPGRSIGTGAVVGAGSIVTRDVPAYAVVVGNPARAIRDRFPAAVVERLLRLAWWDWPHAVLKDRLADFRALAIEEFLERYEA